MSSSQQSEPPNSSSHTPNPSPHVIRLPRLTLLGVGILLIGVAFPAASWPAAFGWLVAIPIAVTVWVLRVRTVVDFNGLTIHRVFGSEYVPWERVRGINFPNRRWARIVLTDKSEKSLPFVRFDRLPVLAAASGGRITDPYAAAAEAEAEAEAEKARQAEKSEPDAENP